MNEYPLRSVRSRDWKYIRNLTPEAEHHTHIDKRTDDSGYWASWPRAAQTDPSAAAIVQRYHKRPAEELYDLTADPWELRNLASDASHAERLAKFRTELESWMAANGDEGLATERARMPR